MILCKECEKQTTCKALCEKAEAYVNQDFVLKKHNTSHFHNLEGAVLQPHGTYRLTFIQNLEEDYGEESKP